MSIKKFVLFVFLISILCSFTLLKTDEPADNYAGIWTEHWDEPGGVDYVDTLKFEVNSTGQLVISCINNSKYIYSEIKPKKSTLSFVMENTVDRNERFIIKYSLKRINDNLINGKIHNSRGQTVKISLRRFK